MVNTYKVQCKYDTKNDLLFNNNTKNKENKQILSQVEAEMKNTNFDVTQCINLITKKEGIITNTAFYILLFIIAFFVIIGIIFCCKGYNDLKETIDEIIYKMFSEKKGKNKNKFRNKKNKIKGKNPPKKLNLSNSIKDKNTNKNNNLVGNKIMNRNMKRNISRTSNKKLNVKNNDTTNNKDGSKSQSSLETLNEDDSFSNDLYDNDYELNFLNFFFLF